MIFSNIVLAGLFAACVSAHITGIVVEPSTKGRAPRSLSGSKKSYFRLTFTTENDANTTDYSVVIGLAKAANSTTSSPTKRTDDNSSSSNIGQAVDVIDLLAIGKGVTTGNNFTLSIHFPHDSMNFKRSKKGKNGAKKGKSGTKKSKSGSKKVKSGDGDDGDNEDDKKSTKKVKSGDSNDSDNENDDEGHDSNNDKRSNKGNGKSGSKKGKSDTKKGKSGTKKGKNGDSDDSGDNSADDGDNDDDNESISQLYTVTAAVTYSSGDETKLQFFTTPLNVTSS